MLIYGKQPVFYALERHRDRIKTLYLAKEVDKKEYGQLMKMGFEVKRIPENAAQSMVKGGNHQGYIAEISQIVPYASPFLKKCEFYCRFKLYHRYGKYGFVGAKCVCSWC